ncbi:MAG: DUF4493 domain-containing protein [Muribaculaceae bacterium]|nr:DUF4493 domain-containing protein [Muribaculaceae bacterium]
MKKTILTGIGVLTAASLLWSCADEWGLSDNQKGSGRISFSVGLDTDVVTSRPSETSTSSRAADITAADLSLRLTKSDGSRSWEWESVADFDSEQKFGVGEYTLEAFYGDENKEGFDCPSYYGKQSLTVSDGQTTSLALTATMSKSMLTIDYTDAFKAYMADWSANVNGIAYSKGETKPVYIKPGDVTIVISVTKPNGLKADFTLDKVSTQARYHYTVLVDVNNGNVGDAQLSITFDDNMANQDVVIDISDDLLVKPEPIIDVDGFTSEVPVDVVAGLSTDQTLSMSLIAQAGIGEVIMTTSSSYLIARGWPAEIDLLKADAQQQATMTSLGLNVLGLWKAPGEMAFIDFAGVPKNLKISTDNNDVTFTLVVKDKLLRASLPQTLALKVEGVDIDLAKVDEKYNPGNPFKVKLGFNGNAVKDNVEFKYRNPISGTDKTLEIIEVSEAVSRSMSDYTVTLRAPENFEEELVVFAICGDRKSEEISLEMTAPYTIVADNDNVYATHAFVSVNNTEDGGSPALDNAIFYARRAGEADFNTVSHTIESGFAHITGLIGGYDYDIKVSVDGQNSKATTIHTEDATQLYNSDMESWYQEKPQSDSDWQIYYPGEDSQSVWDTMNLLTTSEGAAYSRSTILTGQQINNNGGAGYRAKSGTIETSDSHSGRAALIQTVGWGSANGLGYSGSIGLTRVNYPLRCDNTTPGELYLGVYNNDSKTADYGIEFSSRPSALKFWYKYMPKNEADWGVAEIHILDETNSVIAEKQITLNRSDEYTEASVDLAFTPGLKKAAKLQVTFRSTGNDACLEFSADNFDYTEGLLGTAEGFIGSKLYIDDIELIY